MEMDQGKERLLTQLDADSLRRQAAELERRAYHMSGEQGGAALENQARVLRKRAQSIEERLPA